MKVDVECPLEMCDNIATIDDVQGAVSEETFLTYQKLIRAQNSCWQSLFPQNDGDGNFYCANCSTKLERYQGKCPSCNEHRCGVCSLPFTHCFHKCMNKVMQLNYIDMGHDIKPNLCEMF